MQWQTYVRSWIVNVLGVLPETVLGKLEEIVKGFADNQEIYFNHFLERNSVQTNKHKTQTVCALLLQGTKDVIQ